MFTFVGPWSAVYGLYIQVNVTG